MLGVEVGPLSFAGAKKVKDTSVLPSFITSRSLHQAPEVGALREALPAPGRAQGTKQKAQHSQGPITPLGPWLIRATPPFREMRGLGLKEAKVLMQGTQPGS